ncbi:MAG: glycyl-radical enzyme activating protein [Candidatus Thorarchaeota archaeon]|nr:glycyl-radical enzyme activating protein [Candidatus Thorarchaeota archaeon]
MSVTGIITNIQRCSTEDGPGIRTTVFFKGCPLKCIWCHNIETIESKPQTVWYRTKCIGDQACIEACPENALELTPDGMIIDRDRCKTCGDCEEACPTGAITVMGKIWNAEPLVQELLRDEVFFSTSGGGVTLSGGEATYQIDFMVEVARGLRKAGVHVALDTCGYCSESVMRLSLSEVDLVLYDLKTLNPERHLEYTGVPVDTVLSNARIVTESGLPVWIRTPVIPNYTDSEENIRSIASFISANMPNVERFDLLAFNKMCVDKYALFGLEYPLKDSPLVEKTTMDHLAAIAREEGVKTVAWSGMTRREDGVSDSKTQREVGSCE